MLAASSTEWRDEGLTELQYNHCHPEGWMELCCLECFPYLSEPDHSGLSPMDIQKMLEILGVPMKICMKCKLTL
jgi:hypothetical protein